MTEARCAGEIGRGDRGDRSYLLAEITRRIIHLHKHYFGKGPTKGRSYWQQDVITVLLQGGLTPAEQTLRETGHAEAVTEQRTMVHEGLREDFKRAISELTGREVIGFISGIQQDPDMAAEVFVLAPNPDERNGAASAGEASRTVDPQSIRARFAQEPPSSGVGPLRKASGLARNGRSHSTNRRQLREPSPVCPAFACGTSSSN